MTISNFHLRQEFHTDIGVVEQLIDSARWRLSTGLTFVETVADIVSLCGDEGQAWLATQAAKMLLEYEEKG